MPRALLQLVGCALLYCASGCATPGLFPAATGEQTRTIYVVSHGWHAGLVIDREDVSEDIWPESRHFADSRYIEIGWGDEGFYRAQKITASLCLRAALLPTASVLHVVGFNPPVEENFPVSSITEVQLSQQGFNELCRYIHESYQHAASGEPVGLGPGIYGDSAFYRAEGYYYFPKTCNVWTARALREAGCPIVPGIAIKAGNVMWQASRFGHVVR